MTWVWPLVGLGAFIAFAVTLRLNARFIGRIFAAMVRTAPVRLWAMILAGPPLTAFAAWLVWLVRYGWPLDRAQQQLSILGYALLVSLGLIGVIVVALASVRVKGTAPAGVTFEVDGDPGAPAPPPPPS